MSYFDAARGNLFIFLLCIKVIQETCETMAETKRVSLILGTLLVLHQNLFSLSSMVHNILERWPFPASLVSGHVTKFSPRDHER